MEATPPPRLGKLSSAEQCFTDEEAAAQRAATGGDWLWKRLRWMEPEHFLQPGPGSLHSLGPKGPMFLLETAGDKAESRTAEERR